MSAHVFTLEQVCKEQADWQLAFEPARALSTSAGETTQKLHEVLRRLVTTLTLPLPLDEMLHTLASLTMQAAEIDLCVILLKDQARDCLRVCTCSPDLGDKDVIVQSVSMDSELCHRLRYASMQGQLPTLSRRELELLNPLKNVQYTTLYPLPLMAGTECIGLINCYSSKRIYYTDEDQLMLTTIANQAGLAIKHRQCIEEDVVAQRSLVKTFINDLCEGGADGEEALHRRAYFLGYDLSRPHAIALFEFAEASDLAGHDSRFVSKEERLALYEGVIEQLREALTGRYPGSLIDEHNNLLVALLSLGHHHTLEQLNAWLDEHIRRMGSQRHIRMYAGISNCCTAVSEYRRSYAEAREALEVGSTLHGERCCNSFNTLGEYRYIYLFARSDTLRDHYQDQIEAIVEYDRRKKTNLLDTLEIYLECGGNIARTSQQLSVHRNTLLQRLNRLQKLCLLDLEQRQNRLPLLLALKVHKLRAPHG